MNGGLQKLQVPEFKDRLFCHYYYWEFYSLELLTWAHNIAFETFALNPGCLFELIRCMSSTAAASNRPVVFSSLNEALSIQWFWCSRVYWWNLMSILSVEENLFLKSHWGCLKDFLAQMSGWLWVFQWGRPSAKYCGQDDDNPLSLSFIFLSRPFIDNLNWTPIKLRTYISI